MPWIVVEQSKPPNARFHSNVGHVVCWAVAPSQFRTVFFARILSVMNHQVRSSQEVNVTLIAGMVRSASGRMPKRLMIGDVGDCRSVCWNTVGHCRRCVVEVLRLNENFSHAEETFFKLCVMDSGC